MTEKIMKRLVKLPREVADCFSSITDVDVRNDYIRALRANGWTLTAISESCGVTRERTRQIVAKPSTGSDLRDLVVPRPPIFPSKPKKTYVEPSEQTLQRLLELQPKAQQVRSNIRTYRKEAEEYTRLLNYAHTVEGVTLYRLALRLGVTHSALRFRLARYGYKLSPNGKSSVYKPIREDHRVR